MILAIAGLSSCAGYTSATKTKPSDPGAGILSPSATSLSFGSVAVGSTVTQSLTVTNTGLGTATISGATLAGAGLTVVGGNPSGTVAVGQSSTIQIQFAPTSAGAVTGSLTVVSDASNSPLAISITGTGTQTGLTIAPSALTFGNVVVGQSSTQSVKLTNSGSSNLTINLATVAGTGFGISGLSLPTTLPAGQSLSFNAQLAPTSAGAATGSITFTDNAPGSPQVLTMVGTGVTTASTLVASPGSVAFGNVTTGSNGQQSITLTNSGNASATISAISTSGTGFSATGLSTPLTLAVNQSTTFTAQFAPTTVGVAAGSILITSTATNPALSIALSGTGVRGNLTANPASINFGSLLVGASGSVSVTLTNSGTASVGNFGRQRIGNRIQHDGSDCAVDAECGTEHFIYGEILADSGRKRDGRHFDCEQCARFATFDRLVRVGNRYRNPHLRSVLRAWPLATCQSAAPELGR